MKTILDELIARNVTNPEVELFVVGVPEDDADSDFSMSGCELVKTLAVDVAEVDCAIFTRNITGRIIKSEHFKARVCHMVLDAYHNGTKYFKDERGDWRPEYDFDFPKSNKGQK